MRSVTLGRLAAHPTPGRSSRAGIDLETPPGHALVVERDTPLVERVDFARGYVIRVGLRELSFLFFL